MQPPSSQAIAIGNVTVIALSDGGTSTTIANFFPGVSEEQARPYQDTQHRLNFGSYLLRVPGHTILVDTGMGPRESNPPQSVYGELLDDLKRKSIRPDEVDLVIMTHLHLDHIGWNLSRGSKPTFPKARYYASRADWDYFSTPENLERNLAVSNSVTPLMEQGRMELVTGQHSFTPEVSALPTPGHTPGHISIRIASQGRQAVILGDVAHLPLQAHETDWQGRADVDPILAVQTRRALMQRLEAEGITLAAGHFPAPGFGTVARVDGKRVWRGM